MKTVTLSLGLAGALLLSACGGSGGSSSTTLNTDKSNNTADTLTTQPSPVTGNASNGKILFQQPLCSTCHTDYEDGTFSLNLNNRDALSVNHLFKVKVENYQGLTDYIEDAMPVVGPELCDADCAEDIAAYLWSFRTEPEEIVTPPTSGTGSQTPTPSNTDSPAEFCDDMDSGNNATPDPDTNPGTPTPAPVVDLPQSFVDACTACHSDNSKEDSFGPSLFEFSGTQDTFISITRNGTASPFMDAYDAGIISDADLATSFSYFTGNAGGNDSGQMTPASTPTPTPSPTPEPEPELPAAFANECSGCHSAQPNNSRFTDLFTFAGNEAEFATAVRTGPGVMPMYQANEYSDADITATYNYFTANRAQSLKPQVRTAPSSNCIMLNDLEYTALWKDQPQVDKRVNVTETQSGSMITSGAERPRLRHEDEQSFPHFGSRYFENRTFGFELEDFTFNGENRVKMTVHTLAKQDPVGARPFNLRLFHVDGEEGGSFSSFRINMNWDVTPGLERIDDHTATYEVTRNREGDPISRDDILDFEFGLFFDSNLVEGQTAYYSSTFRYKVGTPGMLSWATFDEKDLAGGDTTVPLFTYDADRAFYFSQMANNIQEETAQNFVEGRRLFHTDFANGEHSEANNPTFDEQVNKLGPLFVENKCSACHERNGRSQPPTDSNQALSTLAVKLGSPGTNDLGNSNPHSDYGRQLQHQSTAGQAEGEAFIRFDTVDSVMAGVSLQEPTVLIESANGSAIDHYSVRVARQIVGMGLLEAVDENTILAYEDTNDIDNDGISGKPNIVYDPESGEYKLGRIGWKASKASVTHQVADALLLDMGVTSPMLADHDCDKDMVACATSNATPELNQTDFDKLVTYVRTLGVPPRRDSDDPEVVAGESLFASAGCVDCHRPKMQTGNRHPQGELRNQTIYPYTDLLLHDMGPGLADTLKEYDASPSEWRTAPLWGIGLIDEVNGHSRYLHDGRAASLEEAILWHGGEAAASRQEFVNLSETERNSVIRFLQSL